MIVSSLISPAPITSAFTPFVFPIISLAFATAVEATETEPVPKLVAFLTFAAHLKAKVITLVIFVEQCPFACENLKASFNCPTICVSPITSESSADATEKR